MAKNGVRRRVPLNRERILQTALALVEEKGVEELTMRKLAAVLGVDAMSIYHHVPNKQALLMDVYQRVLEELPLSTGDAGTWQDNLRELSKQFHLLARRYPKVFPHLIGSPFGTPREREIYQHIKTILVRSGLGDDDRIRATGMIYTYAIGIANVAVGGLSMRPLPGEEDRAQPSAADSSRRSCAGGEDDVEFGVDLLIAGIEKYSQRPGHD